MQLYYIVTMLVGSVERRALNKSKTLVNHVFYGQEVLKENLGVCYVSGG